MTPSRAVELMEQLEKLLSSDEIKSVTLSRMDGVAFHMWKTEVLRTNGNAACGTTHGFGSSLHGMFIYFREIITNENRT